MKRHAYLFFFLALALALITGCGGDDEASLTKAQFIQQGDAICAKQNKKKNNDLIKAFTKLEEEGKSGKKAQEEVIADVALPPIAQMTEELADLGLPEEQGDQAEQFITEMEEAIAEVEEDPSLALSAEEPFEEPKNTARKFGFAECVEF